MDCQKIINEAYENTLSGEHKGDVANYIPELGKVNPDKLGVSLTTMSGENFSAGDCNERFSIQSIAKVLSLSLAMQIMNENTLIRKRVGVEPSGNSFNSLVQLESEAGIPRNPLINAGAIVICDFLCSKLKSPKEDLISFVRKVAGHDTIDYDTTIAASEQSTGFRNYAMVNFLKSFKNIENDVDEVIDLYFNLCSVKMSCSELSRAFLYLANDGKLLSGEQIITQKRAERINAIMQTCGFYDEAGEFSYRVGLPGKSGVGGGIVALYPEQYTIAVWSPKLNDKGNSFRGMKLLEEFTSLTGETIF